MEVTVDTRVIDSSNYVWCDNDIVTQEESLKIGGGEDIDPSLFIKRTGDVMSGNLIVPRLSADEIYLAEEPITIVTQDEKTRYETAYTKSTAINYDPSFLSNVNSNIQTQLTNNATRTTTLENKTIFQSVNAGTLTTSFTNNLFCPNIKATTLLCDNFNASYLSGMTSNIQDQLNTKAEKTVVDTLTTNTSGITYTSGTDLTTIDNNLTISTGKILTLNGYNVHNALNNQVNKTTGFTRPTIGTTAFTDNITTPLLTVNNRNILTEIDSLITSKATISYVDTQVANLVNSAPTTLNTLNELATALGNDANFSTTIATQIGNLQLLKADKLLVDASFNMVDTSINGVSSKLDAVTYQNGIFLIDDNCTISGSQFNVNNRDILLELDNANNTAVKTTGISYDAEFNETIANCTFNANNKNIYDVSSLSSIGINGTYINTKANISYTDTTLSTPYSQYGMNTFLSNGMMWYDYYFPNGSVNWHLRDGSNVDSYFQLGAYGLDLQKKECKLGILTLNDTSTTDKITINYTANELFHNCDYRADTAISLRFKNSSGQKITQQFNYYGLNMSNSSLLNVQKLHFFDGLTFDSDTLGRMYEDIYTLYADETGTGIISINDDFIEEFNNKKFCVWTNPGTGTASGISSVIHHPGIVRLAANSGTVGIIPSNSNFGFFWGDIASIDFVFKCHTDDFSQLISLGLTTSYSSFSNSIMIQYESPYNFFYGKVNDLIITPPLALNNTSMGYVPPPYSDKWLYGRITNTGNGATFYLKSTQHSIDVIGTYTSTISSSDLLFPIIKLNNTNNVSGKYIDLDFIGIKYKSLRN